MVELAQLNTAYIFVVVSLVVLWIGAVAWWTAMKELAEGTSAFKVVFCLAVSIMLSLVANMIMWGVWITLLTMYVALTAVKIYEVS